MSQNLKNALDENLPCKRSVGTGLEMAFSGRNVIGEFLEFFTHVQKIPKIPHTDLS